MREALRLETWEGGVIMQAAMLTDRVRNWGYFELSTCTAGGVMVNARCALIPQGGNVMVWDAFGNGRDDWLTSPVHVQVYAGGQLSTRSSSTHNPKMHRINTMSVSLDTAVISSLTSI